VRTAFFDSLYEVAKADGRVELITADMGFGCLEKFRDCLPKQYLNAGISEANAMSLAAGMALAGRRPFVYSITPFVTYRSFEQTRVDVCCHNANVKIIGVGSGLDYGQSGTTHHPTEDIAVMRALPNISVACPGDPFEAAALPPLLNRMDGPAFVRLGRGREPRIHSGAPKLEFGKALKIFEGGAGRKKVALLSIGNMANNALLAAQRISSKGLSVEAYSMVWAKPIDEKLVLEKISGCDLAVSIEEHSEIGGLRSAILEALHSKGESAKNFRHIALPDRFQKDAGSPEYLRKLNGLDAESIGVRVVKMAGGA